MENDPNKKNAHYRVIFDVEFSFTHSRYYSPYLAMQRHVQATFPAD